TRWHDDDLAGRCLARESGLWHVLSIPMEAMPGDPLGRPVGERLWPEWFTEEMVLDAKRDVRAWNALYQQQPAALEGDYFHLEWLSSIGKKDARARSFQALASMGKVFLPAAPVQWKADLIGQLTRFPTGRFDDGVDVCSLIGRGLEYVRPPKIARALERRQAD